MHPINTLTNAPLLRPGLKNNQLNYWLRYNFALLVEANGRVITSRFYQEGPHGIAPLESKAKLVNLNTKTIPHSEDEDEDEDAPEYNPFGILYTQAYEDFVTELPLSVLSCMGKPIDIDYPTVEKLDWNSELYTSQAQEAFENIFFNEVFVSTLGSVSLGKEDFNNVSGPVTAVVFDTRNQKLSIETDSYSNLANKKCMLLVKNKLKVYVIENGKFAEETVNFVRLASNFDEFFKILQNYPTKHFQDADYKQKLLERASRFCTYWGGLAEILDFTEITEADIPDLDFIAQANNSPNKLTSKQLASLAAESAAYDSDEGRALIRVKTAYENVTKELSELQVSFAPAKAKIDSLESLVTNLEQQYATILQYVDKYKTILNKEVKEQEVALSKIETANRTIQVLEPRLDNSKANLAKKLETIREDIYHNNSEYLESKLAKLNVIITSAVLRNKETKEEVSLVGNESLCSDTQWYLGGLTFITTKPHVIRVNAEKHGKAAPEIVGGPYEVSLSYFYNSDTQSFNKPQMFLKLASADAVFGRQRDGQEWQAKIHPHTQASKLRAHTSSIVRFVSNAHNVCLGEAEGLLTNGFNTKDIFIVIATVLSWIGSANTQDLGNANAIDEFGATWTWFPRKSDVSLSGQWNTPQPTIEKTSQEIEEERWQSIKAKLSKAGLPVPVRPKATIHGNTVAAATYMENNENNIAV
jgi:hypothetical protein